MCEMIMALILSIAAEVGVPPYFALAIATVENPTLDPMAININEDKTVDRGVMQLNSSWYTDENWRDPETNIRAGCLLIKELMDKQPELNTYWAVAVAYNCGYWRFIRGNPPMSAIDYGGQVMYRWQELTGLKYINPLVRRYGG